MRPSLHVGGRAHYDMTMPVIEMCTQLSGTIDGADYPPPGARIDVDAVSAETLVRIGAGVLVEDEPAVEAAAPAVEDQAEETAAPRRRRRPAGDE